MAILPDEDHDHPHQRSCWFTHGNVNGVDFWSEGKRFGTIKETGRIAGRPGPCGRAPGRPLTNGARPMTRKSARTSGRSPFTARSPRGSSTFTFRIRATDGPLTFSDTKEGMFGIRVASSMDVTRKQGGKITNAEGLTDEKAWGKPSPWVDYVGPVKDQVRRHRHDQPSDSFRLSDDLACANLRVVRGQSVRLARFRPARDGVTTRFPRSGDRIRLPRGPSRRRYEVGQRGRASPQRTSKPPVVEIQKD